MLPFLDNSLDIVVMNEVIEHVNNDHTTLREISRVLRNGGSCIIFAPNKLFPFETHGIRSEEHTSELQSLVNLVCRLLLEKKKKKKILKKIKMRYQTRDCTSLEAA